MNVPARSTQEAEAAVDGRLLSRPHPVAQPGPAGLHRLNLEAGSRDGLLYVPANYTPGRPTPLAVLLHGAAGNGQDGLSLLQTEADAAGVILLAPESRGETWDMILDGFGPDVGYLDRALALTFDRYDVDPRRLAIGGFSDGASYALSLGLINGRLFTHVLAFSPGFMAPTGQQRLPRFYISHGTRDPVLPLESCSGKLVPTLKRAGYEVRFRKFEGGHSIPQEIRREAMAWLVS